MTSRLQREIQKRDPFESLEKEAALSLLRTCDQMQIRYTRLIRHWGITPSQYNILRILRGEGQPLPSLEIASRMITAVPGITGLIDRLEEAGLVQRERCTEDRRVVYVKITPRALALLAEADQPVADMEKDLLRGLPPAELRKLIRLLEKTRAAWENDGSS